MRRTPAQTHALYSAVGGAIRSARCATSTSQVSLAAHCGITQTHLQKIETGETGETACSLHVLVDAADALDVTLDDLVPVLVTAKEDA